MLEFMDRNSAMRIGRLVVKVAGAAFGVVFALVATFRDLLSAAEAEPDDNRRLHDADMIGEYNHRTGRLDAGTDPYGWYEED